MVRTTLKYVRGTVIALAIGFAPVYSVSAKETTSIEERIANLDPGKYVWEPDRATEGAVEIFISLPLQVAYVYRGGTLIGASTISSGKPGNDTPIGRFEILQKRKEHYSNKYDNAPMPYMQRLTWSGVALHGGKLPGYPASHGCIRLPHKFAAKLFSVTDLGARVVILDQAPSPEAAYAMVTGETYPYAMGGPEEPVPPELEQELSLISASE